MINEFGDFSKSNAERPPIYKDDLGWSPEREKKYKDICEEVDSGSYEPKDINERMLNLINEVKSAIKVESGENFYDKSPLLRELLFAFYEFHNQERTEKETS